MCLQSHCAEAMLSLSNQTTVISNVMFPVTAFVKQWVQTNSTFDSIVARTMPPEWASKHLPVLSQGTVHHLYKAFDPLEPKGEVVICHRGCGIENRKWDTRGTTIKITCRSCNSTCIIPKEKPDSSSVLGSHGLVKVAYPVQQAKTTWLFNTGGDSTKAAKPIGLSNAVVTKVAQQVGPPSVAPRKQSPRTTVPITPDVIVTPPPSLSPSPSPSPSAPHERLTIKIRSSVVQQRSPSISHPGCQPMQAGPITRSRSAPDIVMSEADDVSTTQHTNPMQSLDDIPSLNISTTTRKRRRKL